MYAGHFAAGLAIKSRVPEAPTWGLLVGVGLMDILFGPFVMLGIESVSLTPGESPGFSLDYIDWSHSLATSILWAVLFGILFLRRGEVVAVAMAVAVFSHFVLDIVMHPPDLALWPNAELHLGLGLWTRLPNGWWIAELAFILGCAAVYIRGARRTRAFGGRALAAAVAVLILHVVNAPWLSAY